MKSSDNRVHLLPGLDASVVNPRRKEENRKAATEQTRSHPIIGIMVAALFILLFFVFILYLESIPGRTFNGSTLVPPEVIQEGLIDKVWVSLENNKHYLNVQFEAGEKRHRKCTLSTCGLYVSDNPEAIIGKVPNPDWDDWSHMAMDVGLPQHDYWQLRRAAWPIFGERCIKNVILLLDD